MRPKHPKPRLSPRAQPKPRLSWPIEYKLDPSQWLEWELPRPEGDVLVFAPTREDAVRTMAENGITADPAKLIQRNRLLTDVLKEID